MRLVYRRRRLTVLAVALAACALSVAMLVGQTVTSLGAISAAQGRGQTAAGRSVSGDAASGAAGGRNDNADGGSGSGDAAGGETGSAGASGSSDGGSANGESAQSGESGGGTTIDWRAPSGGTQPDLSTLGDLSVTVSIADQRVYVRSGDETVYTMIASTGMDGSTPTGDFTVGMRGDHFYNPDEAMGADYWVAFLDTTYLFHSVPTGVDAGDYLEAEAVKLGQPASHGCVRLTVADAQWLYDQLPEGTPVHIG